MLNLNNKMQIELFTANTSYLYIKRKGLMLIKWKNFLFFLVLFCLIITLFIFTKSDDSNNFFRKNINYQNINQMRLLLI